MRRVNVFEWTRARVGNRSLLVMTPICEGIFRGYGVGWEETPEVGVGNYTTAIVELKDGRHLNHPIELVQFQNPMTDGDE